MQKAAERLLSVVYFGKVGAGQVKKKGSPARTTGFFG
jgi:hypothetical protein